MSDTNSNESMLEMYIFETSQNIDQLEQFILFSEKAGEFNVEAINEIFRLMHTIKGSSAMMHFTNISTLAHSLEDLFYFLREQHPHNIDFSILLDSIFDGIDFMKVELQKIMNGDKTDGDAEGLIGSIRSLLEMFKQNNSSFVMEEKDVSPENQQDSILINDFPLKENVFKATIFFEEGCQMESLRAYSVINDLKEFTGNIHYIPENLNDEADQTIRKQGFVIYLKTTKTYEEMKHFFMETIFLKDLEFSQLADDSEFKAFDKQQSIAIEKGSAMVPQTKSLEGQETRSPRTKSMISVDVAKLDKLMDLVGEMVIAEAMVIQNPDVIGLELENFNKASRQLHKITTELQDMVMAIRMVPLASTFHKMHRIVRDMSKKQNKAVNLEIIGEETEVDKNIIEHISDPLMHLVRNSIDHGIESSTERVVNKKPTQGTITMEAKNVGSDVLIIIKDDGKGLNKEKILAKARENKVLTKSESEMTDKEIFNLVFLPGLSTNENVSEFSGRGVGMDVVIKNIKAVGGAASIDSIDHVGTTVTLKIPLTLAIIDGMNVRVRDSVYTIPITAIKESFRPEKSDIITDPNNNEMIMVRGRCYPILRLHECFSVQTSITDFTKGIFIMVEQDEKVICLFADELLGQQQVVVKTLPGYIKKTRKINGLAGCTLLGDGSISLILDVGGLITLNAQKGGGAV